MDSLQTEIDRLRAEIGVPIQGADDLQQYQSDPVGFVKNVLQDKLTPDIEYLMRSVRDYEIVIAKSANAVGKTHGAARIGLWFYLCFPGAQVYTAAAPPERNLRLLLWGEIEAVIKQHRETLFSQHDIKTMHLSRSPKEFVTGVTIPASGSAAEREAKFSGKHAPYILFIIDEGDAVPDPVYQGIETCMSGGVAKMLVMYNPRAKKGEVYRRDRDNKGKIIEISAFNHPNVVTGLDLYPGAIRREVVVRRINEYCRFIGENESEAEDRFLLPEFLIGATAKDWRGEQYPPLSQGVWMVVEPAFSHMVLARYPSKDTAALIAEEWIGAARKRWDDHTNAHGGLPPRGIKAIMGLDVADMGDDSNAAAFRYGNYLAPLLLWRGVDPIMTGERAAREYQIRSVERCNVDAIGVGAGVAPHMMRMRCLAHSVRVSETAGLETDMGEFGSLRDQILWSVREWLRTDPTSMIPPDETLIEELRILTYSVDDGKIRMMKKKLMREILRRSPDRLDALALTFASEGSDMPVINTGRPWTMSRKLAGY